MIPDGERDRVETMGKKAKKKVNPRRRPLTHADLKRAKEDAVTTAVKKSWAIMFTVLRDKEGMETSELSRIMAEVLDLADSVDRGYCTISDLRDILRVESHTKIMEG